MKQYKQTLEAEIQLIEGTEELKQEVASVVRFPQNKTPDMLFFSGVFVSSGENLNKAYFLPSELVKAHNTIEHKAIDIEHEESEIVGHIYSSAFVDQSGTHLNVEELNKLNASELDAMNIDVVIAGILYKSRFPELAKEVKDSKWKLSMETYYSDYDVKVGNVIMPRKQAEALGLASDDVLGRTAKILKRGVEIATGEIARVLRNLLFSGCGLVKNPANPRSLILETANKKADTGNETIVVELEPVAKEKAQQAFTSPGDVSGGPDAQDVRDQTGVGICVNYKKRVIDATYEGPDAKVLHEDWCALYDKGCTSDSRSATHENCIRRQIIEVTKDYTKYRLSDLEKRDKRGALLASLLVKLS